jgi:tetratricopeptide (TPR) repeat protein
MKFTGIAAVGLSLAMLLMPPQVAQSEPLANTPLKQVERANSLREQNQLDRALTLYRQAITASPEFVQAYYGLGVTLRLKGDIQGAIDAHRQAIAIDKNYTPAYYGLGLALYLKGDVNGAIDAYNQFIQFSKADTNLTPAYYNLGVAYERRNNLDGAIASFRKAIEYDPKYALAHNGLGTVLRRQGNRREAIVSFRKAIEIAPQFAAAHFAMGISLYEDRDYAGAIDANKKVLQIDPNFPNAYYNLGLAYSQSGQLSEAIIELEKATKIDPTSLDAQNNLKEARRLLALQQNPTKIVELGETKYLTSEPLTPIKRAIVKVSTVFEGNARGAAYGTGYTIKRDNNKVWIITNRHVVSDKETGQLGSNLEVEPYYGVAPKELTRTRVSAKIVNITSINEALDLAVLEVTGLPPDIQPLQIRSGRVIAGTKISIIGHPGSNDWSNYEAKTIGIQDSSGDILLDVNLAVGSSGSPLLDSDKRVVGLMFSIGNQSQLNNSGIGFAHPIDKVLQQLTKWEITIP